MAKLKRPPIHHTPTHSSGKQDIVDNSSFVLHHFPPQVVYKAKSLYIRPIVDQNEKGEIRMKIAGRNVFAFFFF